MKPELTEEELCELILENAHVLTCFNCGETLAAQMNRYRAKNCDVAGVLHIDPGELNYPHEPDVPASAYFECLECYERSPHDDLNPDMPELIRESRFA